MKVRVYLRVAKTQTKRGFSVDGRNTPTNRPLEDRTRVLPTVAFALDLDIPDALFAQAERVIAEISIPEEATQIAADVQVVE